jgi:hypothetical protein
MIVFVLLLSNKLPPTEPLIPMLPQTEEFADENKPLPLLRWPLNDPRFFLGVNPVPNVIPANSPILSSTPSPTMEPAGDGGRDGGREEEVGVEVGKVGPAEGGRELVVKRIPAEGWRQLEGDEWLSGVDVRFT